MVVQPLPAVPNKSELSSGGVSTLPNIALSLSVTATAVYIDARLYLIPKYTVRLVIVVFQGVNARGIIKLKLDTLFTAGSLLHHAASTDPE